MHRSWMYLVQRAVVVAAFLVSASSSSHAQDVYVEGMDTGAEGEESKEAALPLRSFERFQFDPATATGIWAEVGALHSKWDQDWADGWTTSLAGRLAYGKDKFEAGLQVPYHFADYDSDTPSGTVNFDEDDIGDVTLYGKFVPLRRGMFDLGLGGQLSVPTGDEDKFGTEEVEVLPFVSGALDLDVARVTGHVGWNFLTGGDSDPDSLVYGYNILVPVPMLGDYLALRNEFVGEQIDVKSKPKVVSYLPGLDIRIPAGSFNVLLRPTGQVGVTRKSPDWGVGGSIALAQAPRAEPPPPPPPPVAVEPPPPPPPVPQRKKIVLRGVNFDFDKAEIRDDASPVLDAATDTLSENADVSIICEGHTDAMGTDAYNQSLSERRAEAVRDYLIAAGIPARRIEAVGFGESQPVADNMSEDGRAQNRRVELKVQ